MKENLAIWDFELDAEDMAQIVNLDKGCPSMLDSRPETIKMMCAQACRVLKNRRYWRQIGRL